MKNAIVCKSECKSWLVIAFVEEYQDYGIVYESTTRKDCKRWLNEQAA